MRPTRTPEVVTAPDGLTELRVAWRELARRSRNVFLTPEWFDAWIAAYGEGVEPRVAVVRNDEGDPVVLVPLVLITRGSLRTLRFAGYNLGDEFFPLANVEHQQQTPAAILAALRAQGPRASTSSIKAATRRPTPTTASAERSLRTAFAPRSRRTPANTTCCAALSPTSFASQTAGAT